MNERAYWRTLDFCDTPGDLVGAVQPGQAFRNPKIRPKCVLIKPASYGVNEDPFKGPKRPDHISLQKLDRREARADREQAKAFRRACARESVRVRTWPSQHRADQF